MTEPFVKHKILTECLSRVHEDQVIRLLKYYACTDVSGRGISPLIP